MESALYRETCHFGSEPHTNECTQYWTFRHNRLVMVASMWNHADGAIRFGWKVLIGCSTCFHYDSKTDSRLAPSQSETTFIYFIKTSLIGWAQARIKPCDPHWDMFTKVYTTSEWSQLERTTSSVITLVITTVIWWKTLVIMPAFFILLLSFYSRRRRRRLFFNTIEACLCWLRIKHVLDNWCDATLFPVPQTAGDGGLLLDIVSMNIIIFDIVFAMVSLIHTMRHLKLQL